MNRYYPRMVMLILYTYCTDYVRDMYRYCLFCLVIILYVYVQVIMTDCDTING